MRTWILVTAIPGFVLKTLYSNGVVSFEVYERFQAYAWTNGTVWCTAFH